MSYTYRFDGGVFRTDSLCELASKIAEDFPRIGFGDIEQIKDLLWDMSPGDYLEERVLGFSFFMNFQQNSEFFNFIIDIQEFLIYHNVKVKNF